MKTYKFKYRNEKCDSSMEIKARELREAEEIIKNIVNMIDNELEINNDWELVSIEDEQKPTYNKSVIELINLVHEITEVCNGDGRDYYDFDISIGPNETRPSKIKEWKEFTDRLNKLIEKIYNEKK